MDGKIEISFTLEKGKTKIFTFSQEEFKAIIQAFKVYSFVPITRIGDYRNDS